MSQDSPAVERRSFLTRVNTGLVAVAAMAGFAKAQSKAGTKMKFEPALYDKDDWLERPVKHRVILDSTEPGGTGDALLWASNVFRTSQRDYGVENADIALVVVLRHDSASFGVNDAMWEKYGAHLAVRGNIQDPKTKAAPNKNIYNARDYRELPSMGNTLESVAKLGAQFAICSLSTHANAGIIARATNQKADAVYAELTSNLITNGRMVPAGVVTVIHAEERGYALVRA